MIELNNLLAYIEEHEPNEKQWNEGNYRLIIKRNPRSGVLCGYVGVSNTHPSYGRDYQNDKTMETQYGVHGGVTYTGNDLSYLEKEFWYIGFDCDHAADLSPYGTPVNVWREMFEGPRQSDATYKYLEFVEKEMYKLLHQLQIENGEKK